MFRFHASRTWAATAVAMLFAAGSALAQGSEPSKPAAANQASTAVKKAPAGTPAKAPTTGKRLDFAPTGPAAATRSVTPAATRPATDGYDKQDSHCHSTRASDA